MFTKTSRKVNDFFKIITLLNILGIIVSNLYGQHNEIRFDHLTLDDGLSQNTVHCITKDANGYMWFGTQDGLNKFDGYRFMGYFPDSEDSTSIAHHWITSALEDSTTLWIGTMGGGLNKFDLHTESFTHYKRDTSNPNSLGNDQIWCLAKDRPGNLWIGTLGGGLFRMSREKEGQPVFQQYNNNPEDQNSLSHDRVRTIFEDSSGILWIGTSGGGLNKFNPVTETFTRYLHDPDNHRSISNNHVWGVVEGPSGDLWIGTYGGGLNKFDRNKEQFTRYTHNPKDPASISSNMILSIVKDPDDPGTIWIGTWGGGLNKFDMNQESSIHFKHAPADPTSINSDNLVTLYADNTGLMWVGTIGAGINKFVKRNPFAHVKNDPENSLSLSNNSVGPIYEDREGTLWVGTDGGGLNKYEKEKGGFICYRSNPSDPYSIADDIIIEIDEDKDGSLWIGTNKGLSLLTHQNRNKGIFTNFQHDPENPNSLSNNSTGEVLPDQSGQLWIGTGGGGLDKLDVQTNQITHYTHDPENQHSISNNTIATLFEDRSRTLWIGTRGGGLNKLVLNTKGDKKALFTCYKHNPEDSSSIGFNNIVCIYEDQSNNLWIGTGGGGLSRYNRLTNSFTTYTVKDGLPNNVIYGILEDDHHNLWLSTNKGLSKFNPQQNTFTNYDVSHGLQSNEFNESAYFKSSTGKMYFGGINGFNSFFPDSVKANLHIPPVVLTSFKKFDKEVEFDAALTEIEKFEIPYRDNFFSFEFAALDYYDPARNQYAYQLEGFDKGWINSGTRRYASYTNLDGGNYVFRVKASNNDGVWNEAGRSFNINIIPPFWKTSWFRTSLIFATVIAIITVYLIRVNTLKAQKRKLEKKVIERTAELKKTHATLVDISRRAGMAEIASGILHNVGNIFNSVNVSTQVLKEKTERSKVDGLKQVTDLLKEHKNHLRTYLTNDKKGKLIPGYLINIADILKEENQEYRKELSTLSAGMTHIEEIISVQQDYSGISGYPEAVNVVQLVNNAMRIHEDAIIKNGIKPIRNFEQTPELTTEKVKLLQVLVNLYKNAIESLCDKKQGDRILKTTITKNPQGGEVTIEITDNGSGIQEEHLAKIFTYGFTTKANSKGLGLHISALTVKELHGEILVHSDGEDKGATFTVVLPEKSY
ncbi:MAG: histidine kinase [Bacteroidetes bacterium]|nr:histidine kinase [Bacteroidota bacterium]